MEGCVTVFSRHGFGKVNCFGFSVSKLEITAGLNFIFVAPALAGRHRRASFRPFVRLSVRTYVRPSVNI